MVLDANMYFRGTNVNLCVGERSTPIGENPKMDWGSTNVLINNFFFLSLWVWFLQFLVGVPS
jgi:hypothetical protein